MISFKEKRTVTLMMRKVRQKDYLHVGSQIINSVYHHYIIRAIQQKKILFVSV